MREKIDPARRWEYENGFYLTATADRFGKALAHYELFKQCIDVPGDIVEFGVYKGASLSRWCAYRKLLDTNTSREIFAFDTFGEFPETSFVEDIITRQAFIDAGGLNSITVDAMLKSLEDRNLCDRVKLIRGDILKTLPEFLKREAANPSLRW